jgi:hypothetical protein
MAKGSMTQGAGIREYKKGLRSRPSHASDEIFISREIHEKPDKNAAEKSTAGQAI